MERPYHEKTLQELREDILIEIGGNRTVRHARIAQDLRMISLRHGVEAANETIRLLKLEQFGYRAQVGEEPIGPPINARDLIDPLERVEREG